MPRSPRRNDTPSRRCGGSALDPRDRARARTLPLHHLARDPAQPQARRRLPRRNGRRAARADATLDARGATPTSARTTGCSSSTCIGLDWSPEQVSGWLQAARAPLHQPRDDLPAHLWHDKRSGGELWRHLRQAMKKRRKRYRSHDSRGRLAGKRHISERPPEVETRQVDRALGDRHDQGRRPRQAHGADDGGAGKTGYTLMGKLARHTRGRDDRTLRRAHPPARRSRRDDHRRQRHRVPQLQPDRGGHRRARSTSPPRTTPGSAAPTRTRTG